MNKFTAKLNVILLGFFVALFVPANVHAAPRIYLESSSSEISKGSEFDVKVMADFEQNLIFGTDTMFTFSVDEMEVVSVTNGGMFPDFAYSQNSYGTIEIHSYVSSLFEYKQGSGQLALITLKTNDSFDGDELGINCSGSDIINNEGENILDCTNLGGVSVYLLGDNNDNNDDDTTEGEPNSCGGTCGSNFNCQANYFCYEGYCRNPVCPAETNCNCPATNVGNDTEADKTGTKSTKTPNPTEQSITLSSGNPLLFSPSIEPEPIPTKLPAKQVTKNTNNKDVIKYVIYTPTSLFIGILTFIAIKKIKKKDETPTIFHSDNI